MAAKKNNKARAAGGPSKTEFVLGLPRELSAKDVVVKAKEKGLKLSEAYVYKIRSASKGGSSKGGSAKGGSSRGGAPKRGAAKRAAPAAAKREAKPSAAAPAKAGMSKVDFVRSLPPGTSYADAAAQAKPLGIELSKAYFYVLKSEAKKSGSPAGAARQGRAPGRPPRAAASAVNGLRLSSDDRQEQALIDAVRTLGAERARSLIEALERFERG
jgi:hypothetical protein